ncbi:SPOR domain-containing protein [Ideonella sp. A 288]|uniref:SPOR domain-containing protein n=1 Tax=Ideonella sp. A 288 TaxID=1962181 RepID=UPI00118691DD|nr:SPOR domain-containing protein [Ideonella sp. A 288]
MNRWNSHWPLLGLMGWSALAQAQLIEDVDVRPDGPRAVVTVRFAAPVQYLRAVTARSGDLVQAFYDVVPNRDAVAPVDGQRKVLRGGDGLPTITVSDEVDNGRTRRKLVIRLDVATRFTVRAGRSNRSIELVLDGLGDAARTVASRGRATPVEPTRRFQIVLQRSSSPIRMERPLPRSLGTIELRNVARVVEGRTEYELSIGPFNTRDEAQQALRQLGAFPGAAIEDHVPTEGPAPKVAAEAAAGAASAAPAEDIESRGRRGLDAARASIARQDDAAALAGLDEVLSLPPTSASRDAQALIGEVRERLGDTTRARAEYETFLKLYPQGADSQRVRERLAALPAPLAREPEPVKPSSTSTWSGSFSQTYYGGQSQTQTQLKEDLQGTPLEGQIPQVVSDETISATDQKQLLTSVDLGWRYRDAERDIRFSFRDSFTADFMPRRPSRNRLSALFVDYRSVRTGMSVRLGRQSGLGGGVLGRFDGVLLGWSFKPRWKLSAVAGVPTDKLLDTRRHFYGVSLDADALLPQLGSSVYAIQQVIDGHVDRRALGHELRYVKPNASVFTLLEYDIALKGTNIASAQGLFMTEGNSSINVMYDRRSTPMLMLGNALFFAPPGGTLPRRITDLLGLQTLDAAKRYVSATTAYMTQANAGFTTPITPRWQAGLDLRLTNVGALAPVVDIPELVNGRPGTGNLYTLGVQAIGTNLYSARDTHVISASVVSGPDLKGWLASYNNLSVPWAQWQFEPSLRLYRQRQATLRGTITTSRWTPGLRLSYRLGQRWTLESDLSVEFSKTRGPTQDESATRVFYSLGYRYDY